jgi:Cellulase (glycosyl hydrolase family 5)
VGRIVLTAAALIAVAAIFVSGVTGGESTPAVSKGRPLATGFFDPFRDSGSAAKQIRAAGGTFTRLILRWPTVAPAGEAVPAGFDARDPSDRHYNWGPVDTAVRTVVAAGLQPIVNLHDAPEWARAKTCAGEGAAKCRPTSAALTDFATAAARRYRGGFRGLPRVRYWQVWNEPNLSIELMPQVADGQPVSPAAYRDMVNAVAKAVHGVHRDNVVVVGGLAPFGGDLNDAQSGNAQSQTRIRPMEFMRQLLCMSRGPKPKATCGKKVDFDVWAHHPYTYGGPTHKAFHPDDVSIGDLPKMRSLLNAAERAGHIRSSRGDIGFWVTEFSYDSQPADPAGLRPELHARWVSEALYRMWSDGVSVVTWFLLYDRPYPDEMYQSGLFGQDDKPKLALQAFRFPFVAFRQKNGEIRYWGRTPAGARKAVVVEQQQSSWKRVATPDVDRYGIFQGRVPARGTGSLRARLVGRSDESLPFSLDVPADFRFCPWGSFC